MILKRGIQRGFARPINLSTHRYGDYQSDRIDLIAFQEGVHSDVIDAFAKFSGKRPQNDLLITNQPIIMKNDLNSTMATCMQELKYSQENKTEFRDAPDKTFTWLLRVHRT